MSALTTVPQLVIAAAERFGDAPFLRQGTRETTFAQTAELVARLATALRAHGVQPGERVLIQAANGIPTIEAWLAVMHAGALPAAINPALTGPEVAYVVDDLRPILALLDATAPAETDAVLAERGIAAMGLDVHVARGLLVPFADALAPADAAPADAAGIVYTSGTTSRPKGALVRHLAYVGAGQSMPTWLGLDADVQRLWSILPFFHINAQAYTLMTALAHGFELVVSEKFRASTFWSDAAALGVTEVNVIGAMLAILAKQDAAAFVPGSLRLIYAAPALEPAENRAFEARFGVRILAGFGMSENVFGTIESATSRNKSGSIGRPRAHPAGLLDNALRIVRPDGTEAKPGESGELHFRNAAVTPGYWNAPEVTARTLTDGWLHTGDAGYVDADGDIVLVARIKEMIRRRGENVAPREVEDALEAHPAVAQAAVVGVPSALSEEDVVAACVLRTGHAADEETLRTWCATRLAAYKVPLRIVFVDALPLTATMRVAKDRLKAEIAPLLAGTADAR